MWTFLANRIEMTKINPKLTWSEWESDKNGSKFGAILCNQQIKNWHRMHRSASEHNRRQKHTHFMRLQRLCLQLTSNFIVSRSRCKSCSIFCANANTDTLARSNQNSIERKSNKTKVLSLMIIRFLCFVLHFHIGPHEYAWRTVNSKHKQYNLHIDMHMQVPVHIKFSRRNSFE